MIHILYLIRLAGQSAWNRRFTLLLVVLSVSLSTVLLLGIERVRQQAREGFMHSVSGTDLVVGARANEVQLMLYAVFRMGGATNNISWESAQRIAADPLVEWAVPLSLGDSHRGFPVLATTTEYFTRFLYGKKQPLQFTSGKPFENVFDVVLGAEVAQSLGYAVGSRIVLSHGTSGTGLNEHADKPFTVSGILAATGTPVDRTLHIGLDGMEAIHLGWEGGAPAPGLHILPEQARKFNLTPKSVTAVLVGLKKRSQVFAMQRLLAGDRHEALMGVMPGVALDALWRLLYMGEQALLAISGLVMAVGLAGLASSILAGLGERRRELAVLRSVGARPCEIVLLLLLEGIALILSGVISGVVLLTLGISALAPLSKRLWGIPLHAAWPTTGEWVLLAGIVTVGLMVSLLPAVRAYYLSLSDGLTPTI